MHHPGSNRTDTFTLKNGVAIYGGFAGKENSRNQRNWQTNLTILSGDIDQNDTNTDGNNIAETWNDIQGNNAYHVVTSNGADSYTVLDGFIITAGQANGSSNPNNKGGGMYNASGNPGATLTNVTFSGNSANCGGGMANFNSSSPKLTNVILWGNTAVSGPGIFNSSSTPVISYSNIQSCGSSSGFWVIA